MTKKIKKSLNKSLHLTRNNERIVLRIGIIQRHKIRCVKKQKNNNIDRHKLNYHLKNIKNNLDMMILKMKRNS